MSAAAVLLWIALAVWVFGAAIACFNCWYFQRGLGRAIELPRGPQIAIVLPVRGVPPHLEAFWAGLRAQAYAPWRLLVAVESRDDPAFAAFSDRLSDPSVSGEIIVAGGASDGGQKVHNQLAALARLRTEDRIIVFADADIVPPSDWLPRLARPLADPAVSLVSGYRWLMPEGGGLASAVASVCNSSYATLVRPRRFNQAWGGTMALRRDTLDALDIERCWHGVVLDDGPLARAVRGQGGSVLGPRELLVPSPISFDWPAALEFGRRQYTLIRVYMPRYWVLAAAAVTVPVAGWIVGLVAIGLGSRPALAALILVVLLDQGRALFRRRAVRVLWGEAGMAPLAGALWLDRYATPFWLAIHAGVIWSTLFKRRIAWAGRVYRLDGRHRVTIVAGPGAAAGGG